jgi:hypothetical protein
MALQDRPHVAQTQPDWATAEEGVEKTANKTLTTTPINISLLFIAPRFWNQLWNQLKASTRENIRPNGQVK